MFPIIYEHNTSKAGKRLNLLWLVALDVLKTRQNLLFDGRYPLIAFLHRQTRQSVATDPNFCQNILERNDEKKQQAIQSKYTAPGTDLCRLSRELPLLIVQRNNNKLVQTAVCNVDKNNILSIYCQKIIIRIQLTGKWNLTQSSIISLELLSRDSHPQRVAGWWHHKNASELEPLTFYRTVMH